MMVPRTRKARKGSRLSRSRRQFLTRRFSWKTSEAWLWYDTPLTTPSFLNPLAGSRGVAFIVVRPADWWAAIRWAAPVLKPSLLVWSLWEQPGKVMTQHEDKRRFMTCYCYLEFLGVSFSGLWFSKLLFCDEGIGCCACTVLPVTVPLNRLYIMLVLVNCMYIRGTNRPLF